MEITAKLDNARLVYDGQLRGVVREDAKKRFFDGEPITTSMIKRVLVETKNSLYEVPIETLQREIPAQTEEEAALVTLLVQATNEGAPNVLLKTATLRALLSRLARS